jgi:hypothetical protein
MTVGGGEAQGHRIRWSAGNNDLGIAIRVAPQRPTLPMQHQAANPPDPTTPVPSPLAPQRLLLTSRAGTSTRHEGEGGCPAATILASRAGLGGDAAVEEKKGGGWQRWAANHLCHPRRGNADATKEHNMSIYRFKVDVRECNTVARVNGLLYCLVKFIHIYIYPNDL